MAMHDLYRVLKRQSNLFIMRYGMAMHIKEHNSKVSCSIYKCKLNEINCNRLVLIVHLTLMFVQFLTNKYGQVKHYYSPHVETAVIEADIKKLL